MMDACRRSASLSLSLFQTTLTFLIGDFYFVFFETFHEEVATWCIVILILCMLEVVTERESIFHVAPLKSKINSSLKACQAFRCSEEFVASKLNEVGSEIIISFLRKQFTDHLSTKAKREGKRNVHLLRTAYSKQQDVTQLQKNNLYDAINDLTNSTESISQRSLILVINFLFSISSFFLS